MKKIIFPILLLVAGAAALMFNSCKKAVADTDIQSPIDNSMCEAEYSRMLPTVNSIAVDHAGGNGVQIIKYGGHGGNLQTESAYPHITPADTTHGFPRTVTIDYGPLPGVLDTTDGRTRSGLITIVFSDRWHHNGAVVTVSLSNYYVNGTNFQGTLTLTHNSGTSYSSNISNGKCTASNWVITWAMNRQVTITDTTAAHRVYQITGSENGVNRNGQAYTVSIEQNYPLVKKANCPWISSGKLDLTPTGLATRILTFGDGTGNCSDQASVSINGTVFPFTMK
ncbi:MAG: hypothetical protein ABI199_01745 [Bacteroidia bacterium]